jgi:hypothetical protein
MRLKRGWWLACAAVVGYFALALYFDRTYVDPSPPGNVVISLNRPFEHEAGYAFRVSYLKREAASRLANIPADDPANRDDTTSPLQIYEGHNPLGPGHSSFSEISTIGRGRFSHWRGQPIFLSSSDNTDPRTNGRYYWAVVP